MFRWQINSPLYADFIALISGVAFTFAFAPFHLWLLGILAPAGLLSTLLSSTPKKSFWRGFLFGIGFFGTSVYWLFISLHVYGQANFFFAGITTALSVMIFALAPALNSYCLTLFFPNNNGFKFIFIFPLLWTLFEWLRSTLLSGFPWGLLGYSQMDSLLRGFAPLLSVYGVSWITCMNSGLLVYVGHLMVRNTSAKQKLMPKIIVVLLAVLIIWSGAYFLSRFTWTKPTGKPIQVSLIQGNIPLSLKWDPNEFANTLNTYATLTQKNWNSQLIIWPEGAIPLIQTQVQPFLQQMSLLANENHSAIITGINYFQNKQYYNSMLVLGNGKGVYFKRHLVPFGEYLPFRTFFNFFSRYVQIPMSDFSAGKLKQGKFEVDGIPLAPYICYEIAYPLEVKETLGDAQAIIVITDDGWFGKSIANAQHLQIVQMRALETGREILLATNNGITAIINAKGQIVMRAPRYQRVILKGVLQPYKGNTPWITL